MGVATAYVVYECPACEERFVDERRCPDCNVFCRRLGPGGCCPSCGEIVLADDLAEG
jgi:ribosomal protein L32